VERSTRVTRENQTSNQSATDTPATVEQNIPDQGPAAGGTAGPQSSELAERKEEQTNYEINSKVISTVRNSYTVEGLSVAVVVNRARIADMYGGAPTEEQTAAFLAEVQTLVNLAAGVDDERGDRANITVMDFMASELLTADAAQGGFGDTLKTHIGTIINAIAFITVAVLLIMFGFRPLLGAGKTAEQAEDAVDDIGLELPDFSPAAMGGPGAMPMEGFGADFGFGEDGDSELEMEESGSFNRRVKEGPERRLARMVEINEERAAKILRQWSSGEAA
jgi:flagellar M-ring protein FliF